MKTQLLIGLFVFAFALIFVLSSSSHQEHYDALRDKLVSSYKFSLPAAEAKRAIKYLDDNPAYLKSLRQKNRDAEQRDYTPYYNQRPYGMWMNYIQPDFTNYYYYPPSYSGYDEPFITPSPYGGYGGFGGRRGGYYDGNRRYDRYDYTNVYQGERCFGKIGVNDAFGPYAQVMGKQAWMDWAGRNGFDKVWLPRQSVTNDHAIVPYIGECSYSTQKPPNPKRYQAFNATSNWW